MQKDLNYFKEKIKEKRKQTDFRDFLKEIGSWYPFGFYRNNGLITSFPESDRINNKIITPIEFEKSRDSLLEKGINFNGNFINDFQLLYKSIPLYSLFQFEVENCSYADNVFNSKTSYLSNGVIHNCENIFYSFYIKENCNNIFNSFMVWDSCDNIYYGSGIVKSFKIFYSRNIFNSSNIYFSSNLNGCQDCIFCDNLANKKYCINNKELSKKEYLKQKDIILNNKKEYFNNFNKLNKDGLGPYSINNKGRFLPLCENIDNGFFSYNVNNGKNIILMGSKNGNNNFYDCFGGGSPRGDDYYGCCFVGTNSDDLYLSTNIDESSNIFYSCWLTNCHYCIGCIGLKNKSYCILNKQYTKEDWEKEAVKIFEQMETDGTLGDFFPGSLNPFYFNDTVAGLIGLFTKEEVVKDGYMWRDEEIKVDIPDESVVISISDLDDYEGFDSSGNWKINPEILKKVIKDEKGNYYRIVKMEYDFLQKHELPLPRLHWLDRMKVNFGV